MVFSLIKENFLHLFTRRLVVLKRIGFLTLCAVGQPSRKSLDLQLDSMIICIQIYLVTTCSKSCKRCSAFGQQMPSKLTYGNPYSCNKSRSRCPPFHAITESLFLFSRRQKSFTMLFSLPIWKYFVRDGTLRGKLLTSSHISLVHLIPPDGYVEEVQKRHIFLTLLSINQVVYSEIFCLFGSHLSRELLRCFLCQQPHLRIFIKYLKEHFNIGIVKPWKLSSQLQPFVFK